MGGQSNGDEAQDGGNAVLLLEHGRFSRLNVLLLQVLISVLCALTLAFLVTARESREIGGLSVGAKWNDSKALLSLAVVTAICLGYSALKALLCFFLFCVNGALSRVKLLKWIVFLADQILAYGVLSVAAASAEVAYLAKNGQESAGWSPVCTAFNGFCNRIGVSLVLSFLTVVLLAMSALLSALALGHII